MFVEIFEVCVGVFGELDVIEIVRQTLRPFMILFTQLLPRTLQYLFDLPVLEINNIPTSLQMF